MQRTPLGIAALLLISGHARADWEVNLTRGITEISREVYDLHMIIFWICVAIGVVVFGVMLWSVIYHRKSRGAKAHNFHENVLVEITWTLIPFVILIAMAVPATATLIKMYDNTEAELDIQVTGYQWKWRYQYLGQDVDFFSSLATPREQINNTSEKGEHYLLEVDNPLVIPAGKKVRFLLTANDVIHSWWVPDLAVKKDAIPGFINEAWAIADVPGVYRGQCAELCGKDHGFMPIVVEVKPQAEFEAWLAEVKQADQAKAAAAEKSWSLAELMETGEEVYNKACLACHQANGEGIPGAFPGLKNSPVALGDPAAHIDIVLNGKPGTAMQAFRDQFSAVELAAVITYERNAWGNKTGDIIAPAQIAALKQ
ncbi:cytochrome c oxidase subunit II [Neptuniibacter halophilus]|uniref:cytochrome c oxidase subunit II n=1 Tax=Neptuniibacter halophilus TaxID=651666 RepID=UPI0025738410|nr:cytochrome c oxidase subunit II [Neptuniibacter halophilus]